MPELYSKVLKADINLSVICQFNYNCIKGCRCVKVDCYDGTDSPVVYHGNTLTSKVPLEDVLETIQQNAFVVSE